MEECDVEYRIYIHDELPKECKDYEEYLKGLLAEYLAYLSQFIGDYIWHNECFSLSFVTKHGNVEPHLYGQTNYGDNVEDEWFIVFLLFQLSLKYHDIVISVQDSDGDFLLIEAANELPRWLNPETSDNRVFIHNGKLHIILLPSSPGEITIFPTGRPSLEQALAIVVGPHHTLADTKIQQAISRRIDGYPERASQSYHHANCLVPPSVKFLLDHKPTLVSSAVSAFYNRDPIDMKAIKEAKHFPPTERILTRVRFTRCLYAQLMHQDFQPDKKSGWRILSPSSSSYKAHQLGLKLTCGFEILCSKCNTIDQSTDKPSGEDWQTFLGFLTKQGYFKGEVKGSKLYNKLQSQAEQFFKESLGSQDDMKKKPGDAILSLLHNAEIDLENMKEEEQNLPPEDDDQWLTISAGDLDAMLQTYSATGNTTGNPPVYANGNQEEAFNLDSVSQGMKAFVEKVSSHEGAEFPGEDEDEAINFNADSFADTIRQILEGNGPSLRSDSDDDEYDFSDVSDDDGGGDDKEKSELLRYMECMDQELAQSKLGESFEKVKVQSSGETSQNRADQYANVSGENEPVDVDLNLVKNILESFSSQQGLAGPASNILNSMGLILPRDEADSSDNDVR